VNFLSVLVDPVKTTVRGTVATGDVVAVVGKFLARREPRRFTDDFVALDHETTAVGVDHDPFATEQCHDPIGRVLNGDVINKCVRLVGRKGRPTVVIGELVETGGKPGNFAGTGRHAAKRLGKRRAASDEIGLERQSCEEFDARFSFGASSAGRRMHHATLPIGGEFIRM